MTGTGPMVCKRVLANVKYNVSIMAQVAILKPVANRPLQMFAYFQHLDYGDALFVYFVRNYHLRFILWIVSITFTEELNIAKQIHPVYFIMLW